MATHTQAYVSVPVPVTVAPAATIAPASGAPASVAPSAKTAAPKASEPVPNTFVYEPRFTEATIKWKGRTKAQVEVDNTKIAADEKVWEKRKVVPTSLPDDQVCWVVESDASYTLRTFSAIKDLAGDWKQDPRYEDSWYFVVEKPEEKPEEK